MSKSKKETPLMQQYYSIKSKHPDAILLFRVGDFYETFSEDAITASKLLGITLTRRANGKAAYIELAGFPHHSLDTYLPKLVRSGQRVAICEQLEDPKQVKGIVKRGITELVTPGVSINENIVENRSNNFLAGVHINKDRAGVAFLDITTGEFYTAEGNIEYIDKLLHNFQPKEILFERDKKREFEEHFGNKFYTFQLDDWIFTSDFANKKITSHFNTSSLKGFGIDKLALGIISCGAVLEYLDITEHKNISHIQNISRIDEDKYVWLDKFTIRNLEIFGSSNEDAVSLIDVIDKTKTPMGSRLLKRWIALPLKDEVSISDRLSIVEYFVANNGVLYDLQGYLRSFGDLERITSRLGVSRVTPRQLIHLKNALEALEPIKKICSESGNKQLNELVERINLCKSIKDEINEKINDDAPNHINKGSIIKENVSEELDELRDILKNGKDYLANLQARESEKNNIPSLKIAFNNVFGYYIEVRNTHKDKVPEEWIRKQTLVSSERYITEELKEYETKILGAEEKINSIELKLFNDLVVKLSEYISVLLINANIVSQIDCLLSFSDVSIENNYSKPDIEESNNLNIIEGRHPVIEKQLPIGEAYIPNNVSLDEKKQQVIIITGPNMAGKSALLRQTALIVLLAQIGCYVPAKKAEIGIVDKIFTRVGASDNISSGESTFMVEMNEAASILNNMTSRSLILFDELGRGTSTYDGISIAWSIVEYIHEKTRAKTLFATHYHELNDMEKSFKRVKNYNVSVHEVDNKVVFLRKLVRGGSNHSFGIHVAKMAGMPTSVTNRAEKILVELESVRDKETTKINNNREGYQISMFQMEDPVLKQVRDEIINSDINNLTPIDALNKLNEIKKICTGK